ncbi:MAG TPA: response regulator transcription factor [Bryobacteraceae bacterium]|jgi:DNA-binding NarL/FixJ family response regulator|nr:response regulator transcription factor [Bryobacteraceae bacterium]
MTKIRVVIADDHPIFSRGLRQVVMGDPTFELVAEAQDGEAALHCIEEHRPDVAVLDIDMPKKDGFDVVRAMEQRKLASAVVFLTMHNDEELFNGAMNLGVRGYVLKESAFTELVDGIKAVAAGHRFVSPSLSTYLLNRRNRQGALVEERPGLKELTAAERQVLQLIAAGMSTSDVARELCLSARTVENHRAHICSRLNLQGRDALLRFALTHKSELL